MSVSTTTNPAGSAKCETSSAGCEPAGKVCPLCGGPGEPWGEKDGYPLRQCCGILLSWQFPDVESYERQYLTDYHTEGQRRENQLPSLVRDTEHLTAARSRLDLLRLWKPDGQLLDIGTGTGAFVAQATAYGYQATGYEPHFEMGEFARSLGRNVFTRNWRDVRSQWDVITLHDVLEHLTEPQACLVRLEQHLRPGGLIVVEWPEFDAPNPAWGRHIRPLQHITLWSDYAARELFRRCGLTVEAAFRPMRGTLGKISYFLCAA